MLSPLAGCCRALINLEDSLLQMTFSDSLFNLKKESFHHGDKFDVRVSNQSTIEESYSYCWRIPKEILREGLQITSKMSRFIGRAFLRYLVDTSLNLHKAR
jgi:hypothetical protein